MQQSYHLLNMQIFDDKVWSSEKSFEGWVDVFLVWNVTCLCVFISCFCFVIVLENWGSAVQIIAAPFFGISNNLLNEVSQTPCWKFVFFSSSYYMSLPECIMPFLLPSCGHDHLGNIASVNFNIFIVLICIISFHLYQRQHHHRHHHRVCCICLLGLVSNKGESECCAVRRVTERGGSFFFPSEKNILCWGIIGGG